MRRRAPLLAVAVVLLAASFAQASATAPAPSSLAAGGTLSAGSQLMSANGSYRLDLQGGGNLVVYGPHGATWSTRTAAPATRLAVQRDGNLVLYSGSRPLWQSRTAHSGSTNVLTIQNDGDLVLAGAHGTVWSTGLGNGCRTTRAAHEVVVRISVQTGWFCSGGQQMLASYVTTGAVSVGDGTPTGTWSIQAKMRNTWLYPPSGGAYFVHYWLPYDGLYGLHDAPWQSFPFGSQLYRTRGSHGCIHLPESVAAWLFGWAPLGTVVSVRA